MAKKRARQIAALPYRIEADGSARVMLITSRDTKRWVIPKGNPMRGMEPHEAAAEEAFEEAGLSGIGCPSPLGAFAYNKRLADGSVRPTIVDVFPLAVVRQADVWPELGERELKWFSLDAAAAAVDEPELKKMIAEFRSPPRLAGQSRFGLVRRLHKYGEGVTIVRWFQALLPKQGRFFEQFEAHSATLVAGADSLGKLLQGHGDVATFCSEIENHEHRADDIIREVLHDVHRTFITPFDRTAITSLIGSMDDAIDQMNATAKTITLYGITEFTPQMRDMGGIIVEAARLAEEAMPLLREMGKNAARLITLTGRLVQIEGHADEIHEAGMKTLFAEKGKTDPMGFIIGREIYSNLEKVVDKFEDVANEIQGLVLDHA
jgi:uncharacterized protein